MNWRAIKGIYFWVLKEGYKIQYRGKDKYTFFGYVPNLTTRIRSEYKNGDRHGNRVLYFSDGSIQKEKYHNGNRIS